MKARIQSILEKESLQPSRFAEIIGVQRSSISHILSGRNNPSYDMIQGILTNFPQISPDWLLLGQGDMYRSPVQKELFTEDSYKEITVTEEKALIADKPNMPAKGSQNRINENEIDHVLVFYKDKTFSAYLPREDYGE